MKKIGLNFIIDCSDKELGDFLTLEEGQASPIYRRGDISWCLQTYKFLLKKSSLILSCSNHLQKNCINIIHSEHLLKIKGDPSYFIVCIQADFPKRNWAHYHIVQNKNQVTRNTSYITHWTQPGLIKRKPDRTCIKKIAYVGQTKNGKLEVSNLAGSIEEWKGLFKKYNIEFTATDKNNWHDLADVDVLIGIRTFDKNPHNRKPPTKLLNAWKAEIPFIGGHDSAFKQIGTPGEDYLIAESADDVLKWVLKLKDDATLYNKLIRNGMEKSKNYTDEFIASQWEGIFTENVLKRHKNWLKKSRYEKWRFMVLLKVSMLVGNVKLILKSSY
jgi:hypothetical protein